MTPTHSRRQRAPIPRWTCSIAQVTKDQQIGLVHGYMGDLIATVPADPGRDPAPRTHLISAAPDLQAALKHARTKARQLLKTSSDPRVQQAASAILTAAGPALTKARTGKSPKAANPNQT